MALRCQELAETDGLDVVIHNAAHLSFGVTEAFTAKEIIDSFDVNCVGALRVNRAVLPASGRPLAAAPI